MVADALAARSGRAIALFASIVVAVIVGDLALKYLAFRHVAGVPVVVDEQDPNLVVDPTDLLRRPVYHDPITVVPGVLALRLTTNTGAVFGIGKGGKWFFVGVSAVAVGVMLWFFLRSPASAWVMHAALALTLAGALGNLYDRLRYNAVRDMLHLFPTTNLWPWIFNLADAALVVGVSLLVVVTWWHDVRQRRRPAPTTA